MSDRKIRCVLLASRHLSLREGIRGLLHQQFEAVVTVTDETSLVESAVRMHPDVVVADLSLTKGECYGWLRRLLASRPESRVIVLSDYPEPAVREAAFDAGAAGFVLKIEIATHLLPAVNEVLAGRPYGTPDTNRPERSSSCSF